MIIKIFKKLFILFIIITTTFFSSSFFVISVQAQTQEKIDLKNYLTYFYNRYSQHFDEHGMFFKTPGYGITEFKSPQTAREILSLATYYKYRALQGETKARDIIRQAILNAQQEINSRNYNTQSFSDAWAQMDMISLLDQIPFLLTPIQQDKIYQDIINRIESGIQAPDSSNRAALSAVYWQQIINNLYRKKLIDLSAKNKYDKLIYHKIKQVLINDIDKNYWYLEGSPMQFNPHYHLITAMAFTSYAEITGNIEFYIVAKKMVKNLRQLTFSNGMVEAQIGKRPVGLGAQFYLGLGLLNYKFGFKDYSVFLNYAYGDRFFSDTNYPNRLEYHATLKDSWPNYHDDISFDNLAELALLTPSFKNIIIDLTVDKINGASNIVYYKNLEIKQIDADYSIISQKTTDTNHRSLINYHPFLNIIQTYNLNKLDIALENKKIEQFLSLIKPYRLTLASKTILASAYIYGGYTIDEIVDTIKYGPRAVHPIIPAEVWRQTINYQKYLKQN